MLSWVADAISSAAATVAAEVGHFVDDMDVNKCSLAAIGDAAPELLDVHVEPGSDAVVVAGAAPGPGPPVHCDVAVPLGVAERAVSRLRAEPLSSAPPRCLPVAAVSCPSSTRTRSSALQGDASPAAPARIAATLLSSPESPMSSPKRRDRREKLALQGPDMEGMLQRRGLKLNFIALETWAVLRGQTLQLFGEYQGGQRKLIASISLSKHFQVERTCETRWRLLAPGGSKHQQDLCFELCAEDAYEADCWVACLERAMSN